MENPLKEIVRNATFLAVIQGVLFIILGIISFIHPQVLVALAAEKLYAFFWHEFCDIYLEQAKKRLYNESKPKEQKEALAVLTFVLKESLKLLHPLPLS